MTIVQEAFISLLEELDNLNETFSQYKKVTDAFNRRSWSGKSFKKPMMDKMYKEMDKLAEQGKDDRMSAHYFGKEAAKLIGKRKLNRLEKFDNKPEDIIALGKRYKNQK